jgi:2-methylcitrate dehydratase PrpD
MSSDVSQPSLSERVGQFASGYALAQVSEEGVHRAKLSILDATGVALASTRYDFAHKTLTGLSAMGDRGNAPVIGMPTELGVRDSMLMNGALIHGIDYDDSHNYGAFHPTASSYPCVLGTAHQYAASGEDMLAAYILGIEVMVRVGAAASGFFQPAGFHPTGYAGAFGCAVAAGWLMDLNAGQQAHAQGIVLSAASGSMEFLAEGAWTKRLHPGQAAVAGFQAASLAKQGFIGPRMAYEGRFGLYKSFFPTRWEECNFEVVAAELGQRWQVEDMAVKPYPACHYTHSCADAIFALMKQGLKAGDIERIKVKVAKEEMPIVCEPIGRKRRPETGYEAKFSIPYTVALCLVTGKHGLEQFDDEALLRRQDILDLCDRVVCEVDPEADFPRHFSSDVSVELKSGKRLHHREEMNRGCVDRPLSAADITGKFMDNAVRAMNERRARALMDMVMNIEKVEHIGDFERLVTGTATR